MGDAIEDSTKVSPAKGTDPLDNAIEDSTKVSPAKGTDPQNDAIEDSTKVSPAKGTDPQVEADAERVRPALIEALALKSLTRTGWKRAGVPAPESVAAHSWGVAWLVLVLCPPSLDRGRALAIAVVHDLAEVRVGDITPLDGVEASHKRAAETEAFAGMVAELPGAAGLNALWRDYEHGESAEGRFVKACDKLDMALQAAVYGAGHGLEVREFVDSALARLDDPVLRALAGG